MAFLKHAHFPMAVFVMPNQEIKLKFTYPVLPNIKLNAPHTD